MVLPPECQQQWQEGGAREGGIARSEVPNAGLPWQRQECDHLSHQHCLPGSTLAGSRSWSRSRTQAGHLREARAPSPVS